MLAKPSERLLGGAAVPPPLALQRRLSADEVRLAKLGGGARAFYPRRGLIAAVHSGTGTPS